MEDCDIGEMFLNFILDLNIQEYAGVDFSDLLKKEARGNNSGKDGRGCSWVSGPVPILPPEK